MARELAAPAILARCLVKQFGGRHGFDGVDLSLPVGSFLSIFGPTARARRRSCGCSPCCRGPRAARSILGVDALEEPDELRCRIGLISHKPMLYGDLTAHENLEFFASLYGGVDSARIDELLSWSSSTIAAAIR